MSAAPQLDMWMPRATWVRVDKGNDRCRRLADRHYSRQTIGAPMWTRPGYNFVLYASDERGEASFCWWRPKWEAGIERKDGLRVIECTIFRNESATVSSLLIRQAVEQLETPQARADLALEHVAFPLITGISTDKTARGRSRRSLPGQCFRRAGWCEFAKASTGRADVWLVAPTREGSVFVENPHLFRGTPDHAARARPVSMSPLRRAQRRALALAAVPVWALQQGRV